MIKMEKTHEFQLKYNKFIGKTAKWYSIFLLVYNAINFIPAAPAFFAAMKQHGFNWPTEVNYSLKEKLLFDPSKFQFLFFIMLIILILTFFRTKALPSSLSIPIPAKFKIPVNVNFNEKLFQEMIDNDPVYSANVRKFHDTKSMETRLNYEFLWTSVLVFIAYYLSWKNFADDALETMTRWVVRIPVLSGIIRFLGGIFARGYTTEEFAGNLLIIIFSWGILGALFILVRRFIKRDKSQVKYDIESYDKALAYCPKCGYACVNLYKQTGEKEVQRKKTGKEYTDRHMSSTEVTRTDSSGGQTKRVESTTYKIYEHDVYAVDYEKDFTCRNCNQHKIMKDTKKELGPGKYVKTETRDR